jgi:SAM-dependent methyltransferase
MDKSYNYNEQGTGYAKIRQTEPRVAQLVHAALGNARTVLNVGAGTGSYEPADKYVVAVEPSSVMRAQRGAHLPPALIASCEALPFDDRSFDASMAILTIHHWIDPVAGLRELRRVTKGPVVIFTYDTDAEPGFWFHDYAPEVMESDKERFPAIECIVDALGGNYTIRPVPVPLDCVDGFHEAFYGRPEAFLDPDIRKSQSAWSFLAHGVEERIVGDLARDIETGEWDKRYGHLRNQPHFTCALRIITALP